MKEKLREKDRISKERNKAERELQPQREINQKEYLNMLDNTKSGVFDNTITCQLVHST